MSESINVNTSGINVSDFIGDSTKVQDDLSPKTSKSKKQPKERNEVDQPKPMKMPKIKVIKEKKNPGTGNKDETDEDANEKQNKILIIQRYINSKRYGEEVKAMGVKYTL